MILQPPWAYADALSRRCIGCGAEPGVPCGTASAKASNHARQNVCMPGRAAHSKGGHGGWARLQVVLAQRMAGRRKRPGERRSSGSYSRY